MEITGRMRARETVRGEWRKHGPAPMMGRWRKCNRNETEEPRRSKEEIAGD